jgi:hypothetical protein
MEKKWAATLLANGQTGKVAELFGNLEFLRVETIDQMRNKKVLPLDLFLPTSFFLFPTCYVALTSIYRKCCRRFLRDSDNSAKIEIKRALPFQHGKIMSKCFGCHSWNINHVQSMLVVLLLNRNLFIQRGWYILGKWQNPHLCNTCCSIFNTAHAIIGI